MTHLNRDKHQRRSIRLRGYDYAQSGAYFVTVVAHDRACLFGRIFDEAMWLSAYGNIVHDEWVRTAALREYVELDAFVVMPNHVHGIIMLTNDPVVGARRALPLHTPNAAFGKPPARALSSVVGGFKSAVAKRINKHRGTPGAPVWQRNYYEHIIRYEKSLNAIRQYIQANPSQWERDTENPLNVLTQD